MTYIEVEATLNLVQVITLVFIGYFQIQHLRIRIELNKRVLKNIK